MKLSPKLLGIARITLLPLAGGALVALSLPPFGIWPLAILGVAMLSRSIEGTSSRARLLGGLLAGLGQFSIGLAWALQFNAGGYVALVVVESLFFAAACALTPPGRGRVIGLVGWLTMAEVVRQLWPFGGLPLGGIALGQVGGPLAWTARLGGSLMVAGVAYLAGVGLGDLVRWKVPLRRYVAGAVTLAVAVAFVLAGMLAPSGGDPVRTIRVAVVQGGGKRGLSQLQVPAVTVYRAALKATLRVHPPLDLVLWPEDVVAVGPGLALAGAQKTLGRLAAHLHTTLVTGFTIPVGQTHFKNQVIAFGPTGEIVATYEKVHRVPFGEYVPYRWLFRHFANLSDISRDAIPGTGNGMIETPAGRLAVLISFEVLFPESGRSGVRAGGELIIVPTNTSSYTDSQAPTQELAASRLQAIEEGRDVLQAAPTGFSAVITNDGAVLQQTSLGPAAVLTASVPLRTGKTIYNAAGNLLVTILAALAIIAGYVRVGPTRRSLLPGRLPRRTRPMRTPPVPDP
jgi:apolipoprotein N-acyltransferase